MDREPDRRRRYSVVDRSFQYRFLAITLAYAFVLVTFLGITLFVPEIRQMQDDTLSMAVRGAAAERILSKHIWVWPTVLLLVGLIAAHSFVMVHRVAGPLYRFRRCIERIREGDLAFQVRIREKDFLHLEEGLLNEMLEVFAARIARLKKISNAALNSYELLERRLGDGDLALSGDRLRLYLEDHQRCLEDLSETLRFFKTGDR